MTLAPDGTPFQSKKAADAYIKQKELDPKHFEAFKHQGGWVVFNLDVLPNGMVETLRKAATAMPSKKDAAPKMEYFKVIFQAKTNPNDENDVPLSLNGTTILLKRDTVVILPKSYLEVADHTVKNQYEQKPGHDRKIVGKVRKFMYQVVGPATEAEFLEFKKSGNALRDKELEAREHAND